MKMNSATIVYFSPTGTTKKILNEIVKGMGIESIKYINLTLPYIRMGNLPIIDDDILIIGIPVYEERLPQILYPFLTEIKGNSKPAVLVTVYGNIGEGVALNELKAVVENSGFKAVAAGSFIGEHSFSTKELPIAEGRPNQCDLQKAQNFGQLILNKLETIDDINKIHLSIPQGKLPLMAKILPENSASMFTETPYADMNTCNQCGVCVKLCPMSAIDKNTLIIDDNLCLRCFSCVKRCTRKARKIVYKKKFIAVRVLNAKSKINREPEIYL